ncbi:MAG: HD domain-containing protein [[Eubacterium] sulci]|nr:HD domain-containing protein [[Eubacterium] sulci]MBF1147721.1 HD domain-containing protein [[Eubacterium] sulci]MBF1154090.1 HD domain-containing protein [[Eubacterium] sulci]
MDDRMRKQIEFTLLMDKQKNIFRQNHLADNSRRENDAEHAWHMAVMAYLFREYANEDIDMSKVILMCLIHDVVEIEAGDTYAYDEEAKKSQREREEIAKKHIFGMLPSDQGRELEVLFDEFEAQETAEARFAKAMDNLQPVLLHEANGGGDWKEHGVTKEQIMRRQEKTRHGSEKLFEVIKDIIDKHIAEGNIKE